MMNVQDFANLGDYLREFMHALDRKVAVEGNDAFKVEVREKDLTSDECTLLQ